MFKTIRSVERDIYDGIRTLHDTLEKQINLKDEIHKFKESAKQKPQTK